MAGLSRAMRTPLERPDDSPHPRHDEYSSDENTVVGGHMDESVMGIGLVVQGIHRGVTGQVGEPTGSDPDQRVRRDEV